MLLYAVTIFLSAFLLFQVQPMIAKIILPWFGGSAAVWSTCLMFFQMSLLGGYLYAYCTSRFLKPRQQAVLHIVLLAASLLLLPVMPSDMWKPAGGSDPTAGILVLLTAVIGLPYFLLSTTGPLLQAWYVREFHGAVPYRLFALSNLGSMLALLTFPFLVEPALTTRQQSYSWSVGFGLFVILCAVVAWRGRNTQVPSVEPVADADAAESAAPAAPLGELTVLWMLLAACPSVLLLAVTTHMSQNVAPIPFLWIVPLTLYLLSFIFCFESDRIYRRVVFLPLFAVALGGMAYALYSDSGNMSLNIVLPIFAVGFFMCCMVCHGELSRLRPDPRHLTLYYLMISTGGAIGGLFVAFLAPLIFKTYLELPISLVACALLASLVFFRVAKPTNLEIFLAYGFAILAVGLATYQWVEDRKENADYRLAARNFYGMLRVRDDAESETNTANRVLIHGTINHGVQLLDPKRRDEPTSYYCPTSGLGRAMKVTEPIAARKVGLIGLGAGVSASYCRAGDDFTFYEINPLVLKLATSEFTFLADCKAEHRVLLGDARLTLERQTPQQFDLLAVDAFSSDSIPVHLLTRQAFQQYFRHLKPGGILAVHISNKYLQLGPVVAANTKALGKDAVLVDDNGDGQDFYSASDWVLISATGEFWKNEAFGKETAPLEPATAAFRPWTDDYSNLFQILRLN